MLPARVGIIIRAKFVRILSFMVPGDRDGCVETFGSWDSGGWSERVMQDFSKGFSLNPY
jgi:hypothetical protein